MIFLADGKLVDDQPNTTGAIVQGGQS
jgi:hypothetical protein